MLFMDEDKRVLKAALDTYGIYKQSDIAIEEMAELTKAIIKCRRNPSSPATGNLLEEIADVLIMLEQLAIHYGKQNIIKIKDEKIARLNCRIETDREKRYGGMF